MNAYLVRFKTQNSENNLEFPEAIQSVIKKAQHQTDHFLNLDESWYGIHFVMTDEYPITKTEAQQRGISWDDDSLENIIMGGSSTPYKTSFGAARYLNPQQVERMAEKLEHLNVDKFKEWYNPEVLMSENMPPLNWDKGNTMRDWLVGYFKKLVEFYKAAASAGESILIYIA
jgi:hypothetical protein